jgi:hypothetical protein
VSPGNQELTVDDSIEQNINKDDVIDYKIKALINKTTAITYFQIKYTSKGQKAIYSMAIKGLFYVQKGK